MKGRQASNVQGYNAQASGDGRTSSSWRAGGERRRANDIKQLANPAVWNGRRAHLKAMASPQGRVGTGPWADARPGYCKRGLNLLAADPARAPRC